MRAVIQRCSRAKVEIGAEVVGEIAAGLLILLAVHISDTEDDAKRLAQKIAKMRIFEDSEQKMNRSILDIGGSILSVSQFTLYANTKKGNRPSFIESARPDLAIPLYNLFNDTLRLEGIVVATGEFGADMKVSLTNDGPVTIVVDS
jgi:D-tyrosyl-tRNA(Tyr) deacylase